MSIMVFGLRVFETKAQRAVRVAAEESARKLARDTLALGQARKAFVDKQVASWKETLGNSANLAEILAIPVKALDLHNQTAEHLPRSQVSELLEAAVKKGATLTQTQEDVVKLVSLPRSESLRPFVESYRLNFDITRNGRDAISLQLDKAAPTTAEALALAETLRPLDPSAAEQAAVHASSVASTFNEAMTALKARVSDPSELLSWDWNGVRGASAKRALHAATKLAKDPVDVMKALSYVAKSDANRAKWLASIIELKSDYSQAWTLARTARILGDVAAESAALGQATAHASTVGEALAIAAVAREGRLADPVINDAIVKASTLATDSQHEGLLELVDKIRKGIILEEARKVKVNVKVDSHVTVTHGGNDLPEAQTLGQAIMDYFGMRRNSGNYRPVR